MGHKKSRKCSNNNININGININDITPNDLESLRLLDVQINAILISIVASLLAYLATIESVDIIINEYRENPIVEPNPDIPALQSVSLGLVSSILLTNIGFTKYNILSERSSRGEIDYSLEPNININFSNVFGIISYLYALSGAQGIYLRDLNQPIFGI